MGLGRTRDVLTNRFPFSFFVFSGVRVRLKGSALRPPTGGPGSGPLSAFASGGKGEGGAIKCLKNCQELFFYGDFKRQWTKKKPKHQ